MKILIQRIGRRWVCWEGEESSQPPETAYKSNCHSSVKTHAIALSKLKGISLSDVMYLPDVAEKIPLDVPDNLQ